jgi:hypothetical protein
MSKESDATIAWCQEQGLIADDRITTEGTSVVGALLSAMRTIDDSLLDFVADASARELHRSVRGMSEKDENVRAGLRCDKCEHGIHPMYCGDPHCMCPGSSVEDAIAAARAEGIAEGRRLADEEAQAVIVSVTGPTGGWIASPREVRAALTREITRA